MLATSFAEAAGVAGRQKWGLVLSSSARVSQVTYQTVVGVRYPELVTFNGTNWNFGKFVPHERPQRGGFLKKYFLAVCEDEQMVQLEEAYARATVAITRARALCLIMGPLDMKGLLGAATVMGTLMYGAGHVWAGRAHFYLHDHELSRSPPDESFIDMLKQNCCLSGPHFPPPAIVEALQDYVTNYHKVRRLHLIVVDLWRPWKYNTARAREITDQLWRISDCDDTRRVSPFRPEGPEPPLRRRRFAYGYALDGSECPCYLVWPQRDGQSYILLDTSTADTLVLDQSFFRPLGMQHSAHYRSRSAAYRTWRNDDAQAADRTKVPAEVIQVAAHEMDTDSDKAESVVVISDSEDSESASDSEQNDPPSSLASDAEQYELMQASYVAVGRDFHDQEDLIGSEYSKLQRLELVPERWPLARLSFSLQKCVDHLDRVLAGCCWEVHATRADPKESLSSLHQVSKCLTMMLAIYLAKEVAAILRAVLTHDTKKLYDEGTVHLLCSNYIGYNPSIRNCYIHRPDTMRQGQEKGIDPAVAWPVSPHILGHPRNGNHLLLAPDFVTVSGPLGPCGITTVATQGG